MLVQTYNSDVWYPESLQWTVTRTIAEKLETRLDYQVAHIINVI